MQILWVEDKNTDIGGFLNHCGVNGWHVDLVSNVWDAMNMLTDEARNYNLVVIDVRLPWGAVVPDEIPLNYSEKIAGLRLLEAMRGRGDGLQVAIKMGFPTLSERHFRTPVVVLSRIEEVEAACKDLDIAAFFSKLDCAPREFLATVSRFAQQ